MGGRTSYERCPSCGRKKGVPGTFQLPIKQLYESVDLSVQAIVCAARDCGATFIGEVVIHTRVHWDGERKIGGLQQTDEARSVIKSLLRGLARSEQRDALRAMQAADAILEYLAKK